MKNSQIDSQIKYFLYARKSSESEEKQVASIESQINELEKLAKLYGLEIIDKLSEAKSAKAPNQRPVFNELVKRIYNGEANGILCWKLDRLARNPVDGGTINWMLQNNILGHIKAHDRDYYPTDNVLMMSVEFGMANQFIRDLSSNTKRGMTARAEKKVFPSRAPVGYLNDKYQPKGEKKIIVDHKKFPLVRKLWDTLLEKKCTIDHLHTVATTELGLTGVNNNPIPRSVLYTIFRNPFYYGKFNWSGKIWEGNHQPMITEEEFNIAQDILSGRSKFDKTRKHIFAFTGLMGCGECGCMITAEKKIKKQKNGNVHRYTFYRCSKRKGIACSQKCIREEDLIFQINKIVKNIKIPREFTEWALDVIRENEKKESLTRDLILKGHQQSYSNCLGKLDRVKEMRINGELNAEEYDKEKEKIIAEKENIQKLLNEVNGDVNENVARLEKKLNIAETAKEKLDSGDEEQQRNILENLGSNFILKDKVLTLDLEEIFNGVRTASKEVRKLHRRLEPVINGFTKGDYAKMYASSPTLGAYWDLNPD